MNRITLLVSRFALAVFFLVCNVPAFSANQLDAQTPSTQTWHYLIVPYGWIFGMNGTMTVRDTTIKLSTTPRDVLASLENIDFIGQLHMEASKGRWVLLLDPTYLKLTQSGSVGPIGASVTPSMAFVDFGAFYTVFDNAYKIQALVGGRYFKMKIIIRPNRLPRVSRKESFITPILGGRFITQLSQKIQFVLRGDVGGFGIDQVKNTWSASAIANYACSKNLALAVGFRVMGINYSNGSGVDRFALDTRFWGPVIGIMFRS